MTDSTTSESADGVAASASVDGVAASASVDGVATGAVEVSLGERNLTPYPGSVSRAERETLLGQRGVTVWFTGLSGSGKSTLVRALERRMVDEGRAVSVLDGDTVRTRLSGDLGFSPDERAENIRRVAEVARLMNDSGLVVLAALISPAAADRARARRIVGDDRFVEVFVATPLEECRRRDPKGLYARAATGQIPRFTGITAPYEAPIAPDIVHDTTGVELADSVEILLAELVKSWATRR